MIKTSLWSLLFSFCLLIIETALLSNIYFIPVVPDLLLLCLLFISFTNGAVAGEVHGFFSGLLLDFLSASPLGLNSLLRTIIGFFTGLLKTTFNTDKIFFPALLASCATLLKALLLIVLNILFGDKVAVYNFSESLLWIELCMNTVLAPVMFNFLGLFSSLLIISPKSSNYAAE